MTFDEVLAQVLVLLQREQRVSYRALKRRFDLDDDYIEDLKDELIYAKKVASDEDERVLVWIGETGSASPPTFVPPSPQATDHKSSPISYTPQYLTEKILTSRSALEGERKQVTVLFADIKDSTELIRDLDPEDAQKLLDPAIHIMMDAVHRFEGTVNQVLGDGIMSLFGAPIAHEDHAARACYAALAMQGMMRPYTDEVLRSRGIAMQIRVGLNSGEVVVRTIGNDLHMDYSAVGPSTHLAARMEQIALPGSIMLSSSTLRFVEGLVLVHARGPVPVKGMTEPIEVYELTGASGIRRRLQAAVSRGLTRFVGRSVEIEALHQALEQAGSGHGQLVAAMGLAGVGKSRLFFEFIHSHRIQGWLVLESASVSYGKATPYFPVIDLLKRYIHAEDGDDARTIQAKVTGQTLILDESLQDTIPALLSLLDALPEDSPFLKLDPPQRRQRILDGLKRILLRESQVQPLVLVFEDLHWIDSETQALLDSLVESLPTAQLLLLVNYRPEYTHNWGSKTYYTQLRLDPLPPESAEAFLDALLGDDPGLASMKKLLIERTEGNPFFLEESVRTLVETQVLAGEPGMYRLVQDLPTIQVPATVQAVLVARIDRLPREEKNLLQTAAVIGTELPFTLLQAIAEMPEDTLYHGLIHLQATEFLYETSLFPERVYTFKHALTHEVAYGGLLHKRRRVLHARIVEALETLSGDRLADQVERLAHHAWRGEIWAKALMYCRQAGAKGLAQSAYREAVGYFEQALVALSYLPEHHETQEQAIDLRLALRTALLPFRELGRIFELLCEAEVLAETIGDQHRQGQIALFLTIHASYQGHWEQAFATCQRALALATACKDTGLQGVMHNYLSNIYYHQGDYQQAIDCGRKVMTILTGETLYERFGLIVLPAVSSRLTLSWSLAETGAFQEAKVYAEEAIRIAETIAHPQNLIYGYTSLGLVALRQGDISGATPPLEQARSIVQELRVITFGFALMAQTLGPVYLLAGRHRDALTLLRQAVQAEYANSSTLFRTLCIVALGDALRVAGHVEEAYDYAQQALDLSNTYQERGNQAYALRLLGNLSAHEPIDTVLAETHYHQALTLADELGMRPLQAHCHRDLGILYHQSGQVKQAHAELTTAIEMYRDMEMTFWLPATEVALAAVEKR